MFTLPVYVVEVVWTESVYDAANTGLAMATTRASERITWIAVLHLGAKSDWLVLQSRHITVSLFNFAESRE